MFTKNIGIIFFISYLKATILEMSSQLNNVNQINNNSTDDKFTNAPTNDKFEKGAKDGFKDIQKGSYIILFNKIPICHLFLKMEDMAPIHILNKYDKAILMKTMKTANIKEFKTIKKSGIEFDDYNINLICEEHEDGNEIFIEDVNKKRTLVKKLTKTLPLKENNEYVIDKLVSHDNTDKTYSDKSYYIKTIEKKQFWLGEKIAKRIQKHIKFTDNGTFITYNNQDVKVKLTLKTEGKETIQINGEDKDMIIQKIYIEFGQIKFAILGNKSYNLTFSKPVKYNILFLYIEGKNIYGYDYNTNNYYLLDQDETEMMLNHVDEEIKKDYYEGVNQKLYTYLLASNGSKSGLLIEGDAEKNRVDKPYYLHNYFRRKDSYDITKLTLQQTEEELKEAGKAKTHTVKENIDENDDPFAEK